jgi:DNA replication protein DnaC
MTEQTNAESEYALELRRQEIKQALYHAHELLPPWRDWATLEKLATHPAIDARLLEAARTWDSATGSLVLIGPTGAGKSACAHALARRLIAHGFATALAREDYWRHSEELDVARGMRWYAASKLALARKQAKLGSGEAYAVGDAIEATILFIDELGYEQVIGDGVIFDIVNSRYEAGRPTIVTSGRTEGELVDRYGAAFMRRLREPGQLVDVHPKGGE